MYLTKVKQEEEIVATTISDILSDAVGFANRVASKGDSVTIYEVMQSLSELEVIGEVMSFQAEGPHLQFK